MHTLAAGAPWQSPPLPRFAACDWGEIVGLLVLLFAMRDDIAQVPVVQVATHIWWESRKHLLDLGKEQESAWTGSELGPEQGVI